MAYQLLAGRLPYDAASLTELAMMQQRQYPVRLDEIAPDVPAALAIAVERALELEPEQRYAQADEMRRALHEGARGIAPGGRTMRPRRRRCCAADDRTAATRAVPASRRLQPQAPRTPPPPRYDDARPRRAAALAPRRPTAAARGHAAQIVLIVLVLGLVAAGIAFAYSSSRAARAT